MSCIKASAIIIVSFIVGENILIRIDGIIGIISLLSSLPAPILLLLILLPIFFVFGPYSFLLPRVQPRKLKKKKKKNLFSPNFFYGLFIRGEKFLHKWSENGFVGLELNFNWWKF